MRMREIKFRGQRIYDGEWVYGYYCKTNKFGEKRDRYYILNVIDRREGGINAIEVEVIPETLGQYTGLKDKSGDEIYEGDIVFLPMTDGGKGDIAIFKFNTPNYYLKGRKSDYEISEHHDPMAYKVIGNVYDDSKLLMEDEK